jgi:hypothetical protein
MNRLGAVIAVIAVVLVLPATSLASPPPGKGKPPPKGQAGSARGIVQSLASKAVVVKELDGTAVRIPVAQSTHVFFDGKRATLADVRPGLVAIASWKANKAAQRLQIFDASATVAVVRSVKTRSVVVTMPAGSRVTIRATPATRVLVDGKPSQLHAVKAGFLLVIKGTPPTSKPATELVFLRPG